MKTINIIGAGRVGMTLGRCFVQSNLATLQAITCRTREKAEAACQFIGAGKPYLFEDTLPNADIYLITTLDDAIQTTAHRIVQSLTQPAVLVHCSGNLPSSILRSSNHAVASIHPVRSFADAALASANYAGTLHAIEGDALALQTLKPLFEAIGGQCFEIEVSEKSKYHAGLVIANNYLTTLHYHATQLLMNAGLSEADAKSINTEMMQQALQNLQQRPHAAALTGPLKRGDLNTVQKHLEVLKTTGAEKLYQALAQATLPLTNYDDDYFNLIF